jgi:hypothetical protein
VLHLAQAGPVHSTGVWTKVDGMARGTDVRYADRTSVR